MIYHIKGHTGGVIRINMNCRLCDKDNEMKKNNKRIIINKYQTF